MSDDLAGVLPLGLRNALETGSAVLFVGAGVGSHAYRDGLSAPDAAALAIELASAFDIDAGPETELSKVAQVVELRKGRAELEAFLSERLANLEPDETLQWLFSLTWRAVFTTNYDRVIERAYELIQAPTQTPVPMSVSANLVNFNPGFEVPIYHLHGALYGPTASRVLITEDDYANFRERRRMLFDLLKVAFATVPIVYVGYSNRDPNWRTVLAEVAAEFAPNRPPLSYRITPQIDPLDREILMAHQIQSIDADLAAFREASRAALGEIRVEPRDIAALEGRIPPDLLPAFRATPAAVVRLLSSWVYVNQTDFAEAPNTEQFLRGDIANWGLVGQDLPFLRDVEEPLTGALLDFATDPRLQPRATLLLAPAGYGVTTTLMAIASHLARERAGAVFMHRRGQQVIEGDMEFACSLAEGPKFFVVDNAADRASTLATALQRFRETRQHAMVLAGERLNEWRQQPTRLRAQEFGIEPLSDPEIDRLLAFLEKTHSLGNLQELEIGLRRAAIKEKHSKELLVVMREATEGRAFDAIIQDEYSGIGDDYSRRLYAAVCAFYRLKAFARDAVAADILETEIVQMYERTGATTDGVVVWELIDEVLQTYAARARHHIIADVVWHRCLSDSERGDLLERALEALNLNFHLDARAFEHFIRAEDAIDSIQTLEGKIQFFERAARKDPQSPYVRQHYARMLRREGRMELALAEADRAIAMAPDSAVLLHTKGLTLSDLTQSESLEIARRRLVQAEDTFRQAIRRNRRSAYPYHGLASLYLGWAKRVPEEAVRYLSLAEEVIGTGLQQAWERESLWIVSSDIQQWLGDEPGQLAALERAVTEVQAGSWSRYLLARAYDKQERFAKAADVLQPLVESHPEETRSLLLYARVLHRVERPYAECIAVLRLAAPNAWRDPGYIATLGGMLFMDRQYTDAKEVFDQAAGRNIRYEEALRVEWRPFKVGKLITLTGTVVKIKAGYSFVETPGYPNFFCPGSKYNGVLMEVGKRVQFTPVFTARGQTAVDIIEE